MIILNRHILWTRRSGGPDAVFFEATRDASRLRANVIVEWPNANLERIHIAPLSPRPK